SAATATSVASSFSARAISKSCCASRTDPAIEDNPDTVASTDFFSLPRSWARFGSLQTLGSVSSVSTSARRFCLPSKSKIPPQLGRPRSEVREHRGDLIDAFGFHVKRANNTHYSPSLVLSL